jgi:hypothetical protein
MNIRDLLKDDFGIDVRIAGGMGVRNDPFVLEPCSVEEAAWTQLETMRGLGMGRGQLWRTLEWKPCEEGPATEVFRRQAVRFDPKQIETLQLASYFDSRAVAGSPCSLHPLTVWKGPAGTPSLPFELGWLHFDSASSASDEPGHLNETVYYSGQGVKATVYVYSRADTDQRPTAEARKAELANVVAMAKGMDPQIEDPWPTMAAGPLSLQYLLADKNMTVAGVAASDRYFVKVRMTYFDDLKMREMMNSVLTALAERVQQAWNAGQGTSS